MIHTIATLREDEVRYRERGCFVLAVQRQQQADLLEAGLRADDFVCSFLDRGTFEPVRAGLVVGGMVGFLLPSGLAWVLTRDMLVELWGRCTRELEMTPEVLAAVAIELAEERGAEEAANGVRP